MNRRGFLSSCLALAAAPAIVRADSLMRIVPRNTGIITFDGCDQWMDPNYPAIFDCDDGGLASICHRTFVENRAQIETNIRLRNAIARGMRKWEEARGSR